MKQFFKMMLASMVGFLVTLALLVVFFFVVALLSMKDEVEIKDHTVLELNLGLDVAERTVDDPFARFGEDENQTLSKVGLDQIIFGIDRAAKDPKIDGIYLKTDLYSGGLATAEEIRNKLIDFKKSGKFVVAYGEYYTELGYYIASAASKVFLNPKGNCEFDGFAGSVMFYKGLLDKVGIEMQVFKAGKYKSAVEPFVQKQLSEPNKEQIKDYITEIFGHHLRQISAARKIDSGKLALTAHQFSAWNAKSAKSIGLVDSLAYPDQVETFLRQQIKIKTKTYKVSFAEYSRLPEDAEYSANKIAVVYGVGDIELGKNESGQGIGSETMAANLRKAREDKGVKAVVLRVNSPGGSSLASDVIAREVELLKKAGKPVVVSYGDVAASGGYYISALADSIFAQPNSITGSIGVFALVPNTAKLFNETLGLTYETVPTGEYADFGRPDKPLSENQKHIIQQMIDEIYTDFVGVVAKGRKMDTAQVHALAQGHVYTAIRAKKLGLIDAFGGLQRAIASAAKMAKLKNYRLVMLPKQKTTLEQLFGNPNENIEQARVRMLKNELGDMYQAYQLIKQSKKHTGIQMWLPYRIQIQ